MKRTCVKRSEEANAVSGLKNPNICFRFSVFDHEIPPQPQILTRSNSSHVKTASSIEFIQDRQGKTMREIIARLSILNHVRWSPQRSMSRSSRSERSTSTDIRAIDSNVSPRTGANQKELTIECEEGSRVKLSCHLYVFTFMAEDGGRFEFNRAQKED